MKFTAWYTLRKFVYNNLHNEDYESRFSRGMNIFLIALIMSNAAAVLIESIQKYYVQYHDFFYYFELFSIFVFTLEYILRFWSIAEADSFESPWTNRMKWVTSGGAIIDLLAILPAYLNFFVHFDLRFLRIVRLLRHDFAPRHGPGALDRAAVPRLVHQRQPPLPPRMSDFIYLASQSPRW